MSCFADLPAARPDPILGIAELIKADTHPRTANLGIGVYHDAAGRVALMDCVREAEARLVADPVAHAYLPMDGDQRFVELARGLIFGEDSPALTAGRIVTVQGLGGTGALRLGADFLHRIHPDARVLFSDPTWDNHEAIFLGAGFATGRYRYLDAPRHAVDVDGMLADLETAVAGTVVVLHACCHNPTGYDLTQSEWRAVIDVVVRRGLIAFFDLAYQGLATSLDEDAFPVRLAVASGADFLVASSFSKNLGLYGERVGALSLGCADAAEAARVLSQVKLTVRRTYSSPPTHGAAIVRTILADPALRAAWTGELAGMRMRVVAVRESLVAGLEAAGVTDAAFIAAQHGLFSYTGLSPAQMARLRSEWGVYGVDSGRICVAALNDGNLDYVCQALAAVWRA
ncbi:MAG: aspartate/tyrosine/aromatic aminotransferase [Actinomycetia bacterium]|nr:aspartate/tyrosine/aromatic aminotransferase [Actinomycetes bacterium]